MCVWLCMVWWTWNLSTTHSNYPLGQNAPCYKRVKSKVHTSECTHFLYTVFILSPNIAILIVWTIVIDPYRSDDTCVEYRGFIIIEERCRSDYVSLWFLLLCIYYLLLSLAVVIVAINQGSGFT